MGRGKSYSRTQAHKHTHWLLCVRYFARRDFNVTPDATHMPNQFGMNHMSHFIQSNSRIVFVYGLRDPWHTMGVGVTDLYGSLAIA